MWSVVYLEEAQLELAGLPKTERNAMIRAVEKLETFGPRLGYPHTSAVQGCAGIRKLRPRAGRSPWRALYRQVGEVFVIAAIGPEANSDQRGFDQATRRADARLDKVNEG
ncbi:MAG: type II toxin-antitoxin system RelE/ParE family toxin [Pseudonocardiaceae bacterium]